MPAKLSPPWPLPSPYSPALQRLSESFFDCLPDGFFWSPKHAQLVCWAGGKFGGVTALGADFSPWSLQVNVTAPSPPGGATPRHGLHPL